MFLHNFFSNLNITSLEIMIKLKAFLRIQIKLYIPHEGSVRKVRPFFNFEVLQQK
jgi:hypothetical protein